MAVLLVIRWTLLAISSLLVLGQNKPELESILDATDEQVQEISRQAVFSNANVCENISSCSSETCFRQACKPRSNNEIQSLSCLTNTPNPECSSLTPNATCNNLRVSKKSSYVRLSPLVALETDPQVQAAICAQKALDQKLKQAWESTSKVSQGWIFFGGIEGYLYIYPGRDYTEDVHCSLYDPRRRPWYTYALAVVKSLYVALDTSSSMSNLLGPLSTKSRLIISKDILAELLHTLTNGDRLAVSRMNGQTIGDQVSVVFEEGLQTSFNVTGVRAVNEALNMTKVDGGASSIKNVFTGALDFFRNSTASNLPVILLLTDGVFAKDTNLTDLAPLFTQLKEKGVVVFVYQIGFQAENDAVFKTMQLSLNMSFEAVKDESNPLLKVQSYLDYIAWTRFVAVDKKPVWAPMYTDSSGRSVTSSVFPAFDANHRLIGVSCIDIVADDLVNKLGLSFVQEAVFKRSPPPTKVQNPLPLSTLVSSAQRCDFSGKLTPICPRQDFTTPMADFVCCGNCSRGDESNGGSVGAHSSSSKMSVGKIIGIVVGSVVALMIIVGVGSFILCRPRVGVVVVADLPQPDKGWVVPSRRITLNRVQEATENRLSSSSSEGTHAVDS